MPMYDWKCDCGRLITVYRKLGQYKDPVTCDICGGSAERVLSAPKVFVQGDVCYTCPITGKPITSAKAHRENLAQHGCRVLESGEREAVTKRREAEDQQLEERISETAAAFVEALPPESREQLGREIESGLDCTVIRQ
jgi:putative FmdB family regulatory protein